MTFNLILSYLIVINFIAFIVFGEDKRRAVKHRWRIPEATLLGLALLGGSVGALAGMRIFHHKTRKSAFKMGIPLMLLVQLALLFRFMDNM